MHVSPSSPWPEVATPSAVSAPAPDLVPDHYRPLSKRALAEHAAYDVEIEAFLRTVDRRLVPHMKRAAERIPTPERLAEGIGVQIRTGGKRMRAALALLACELSGAEPMRALEFAAAIEHIQNLTLIHDDIADGDPERRSQPSLWRRYGVAHAVNMGDAFVPLGLTAILEAHYPHALKIELLRTVSRYGRLMATGQALDLNLRHVETPGIAQYVECTRKKTGAFLAMAVVGGALIGGAPASHLEALDRYATLAGVAFQIKDDLLDISGHKGRAMGCDLREGKITAHVIQALARATPLERQRLRRLLQRSRRATRPRDIDWALGLFRSVRAAERTQEIADRMIAVALDHLQVLPPNSARQRLIRLSTYLSSRLH